MWRTSTSVIPHSSVHLPGESITTVESGLAEDQRTHLKLVVVYLLSMLPVVVTVVCVGELLAIKLELQMHFDLHLYVRLIKSMCMDLA